MSASPVKPADVGSVSSAGNSSTRTYLAGSSMKISNSIGTRLLPRTRLVCPEAISDLTESSLSPPNALRASASTCSAFLTASGFGGVIGGGDPGTWAKATIVALAKAVNVWTVARRSLAMLLP
jgi:hypothetical protein